MTRIAPFGSWISPVTSDLIVSDSISLSEPLAVGDDIFWLEGRPQEKGRSVLVHRAADGAVRDLTPPPFNVRTRVHEYGGGAYAVAAGAAYFTNFADQQIYRLSLDGRAAAPEALTPPGQGYRYADFVLDPARRRLIAVREDHSGAGEPVNSIVAIALDGDERDGGTVLAGGHDFYAAPRLNPHGTRLVFLTWDHPNMPWDSTTLWLAELEPTGAPSIPQAIAGGSGISVCQPAWAPDGTLHFIADPDGWWNLYRRVGDANENICPMAAEFGEPQWVFGQRAYGFVDSSALVCVYQENGISRLARLDRESGNVTPLETPFSSYSSPLAFKDGLLFIGGSTTAPAALVHYRPRDGQVTVLARASEVALDPGYLAEPEPITFPSADGRTAHAYYYAPRNRDFEGLAGAAPPLLVFSHGGPTSRAGSSFNLSLQFWTSRGFAVVNVNYGGSTGYGRAYRELLKGQWGVVDVEDCLAAARFLAAQGLADARRLAIRGGSAGGYTTLCALTFHDLFSAGASYFGVSDLSALAEETHKFESRYLDQMVGPYPAAAALYAARAPIQHVGQIDVPVIFFQGLEDRVVPPNQSERMYQALLQKGIPTAYVTYEGEQHGFRQAANIKHSLENELYFYTRVFGIDLPAGSVAEPISIENLDPSP